MNEAGKLEVFKKKLEGICEKNGLTYRLNFGGYPLNMVITPLSDMDSQITMLESIDDGGTYNSPDAKLVFSVYDGELRYKISERFTISDPLFSKLKNLFRNIWSAYLQMFHRDVIERGLLRGEYIPPSTETDSNERLDEELEESEPSDPIPFAPEFPDDLMEEEDG